MSSLEGGLVDEENAAEYIAQNDLRKLRNTHFTAGVREGKCAGKESVLQHAFKCGFKEAFCRSCNFGKMRGILSALLSYMASRPEYTKSKQAIGEKINVFLSEVNDAESRQIEKMKLCLTDNKFPQEDSKGCHCSNTVSNVEQNDLESLRKIWDQCKYLCDEVGIDIQKIII